MVVSALLAATLSGPGLARRGGPPDEERIRRLTRDLRGVALLDATTGQPLFLHRAHEVHDPASTVKLMLLLLTVEELEAGRLALTDSARVSRRAFKTGGQQLYLAEDEAYTVETMALATAIHSANDAAVVLAERLFGTYERTVAMMNQRAQDLGLTGTEFHTPHGLPPSWGQHGDRSTAWDLALLGREAARHPELLRWTSTERIPFPGRDLVIVNSNKLLGEGGVDGLKTGFTQRARYTFVGTAERDGRRLVLALLGVDTSRRRFDLTRELFDYGFARFERRLAAAGGTELGSRPVAGSRRGDEVRLVLADSAWVWTDPDRPVEPTLHLAVDDTLHAPLRAGERVGEAVFYLGRLRAARVPVHVDREVPLATAWGKLLDRLGAGGGRGTPE